MNKPISEHAVEAAHNISTGGPATKQHNEKTVQHAIDQANEALLAAAENLAIAIERWCGASSGTDAEGVAAIDMKNAVIRYRELVPAKQ